MLEFDTTIGNTNQEANSTIFYILSKQSNLESYLLKLETHTYNGGEKTKMERIINVSGTSIKLYQFFTILNLLLIEYLIKLFIMSLDNNVIFEKQEIKKIHLQNLI